MNYRLKKIRKKNGRITNIKLCGDNPNRHIFFKSKSNPLTIDCPSKYHVICIRKGTPNTGLQFYNENGDWKIKTYGEDNEVDTYISVHQSCAEAQNSYDSTTSNWWCDISAPGKELKIQENKAIEWKNNQCVQLCSDSPNRRIFFDTTSNPLTIDCPGKYHVVCIRKGTPNTGLHFYNENGDWKINTYGENKEVQTFMSAHETCSEAQNSYDRTTDSWWCDISAPGRELKIQENKTIDWKNNQCVQLCSDSPNRRIFFDTNSNPLTIDCPGKYNVVCIRRGSSNTGLHFYNDNGIWKINTYGENMKYKHS